MFPLKRSQQGMEVLITAKEIHFRGIYYQRAHRMLADELHVHVVHLMQVSVGDLLFVSTVPLFNVLLQALDGRVQEYQDIRLRQLRIDDVEQLLVQREFIILKVHLCKQQAFHEEIIADSILGEQVTGGEHFFQLLVTFRHEEELQWKGVLVRLRVEFRKKRIISKTFQDQLRPQVFGQPGGEGGLSRADIAFYGDEAILHVNGLQQQIYARGEGPDKLPATG